MRSVAVKVVAVIIVALMMNRVRGWWWWCRGVGVGFGCGGCRGRSRAGLCCAGRAGNMARQDVR